MFHNVTAIVNDSLPTSCHRPHVPPFVHNPGTPIYQIPALCEKVAGKLEKMGQVKCKMCHFLHRLEEGNGESHIWVWHFLMSPLATRSGECPEV